MHLSVGKLHKILLFVSLVKPANKQGHLLAMQMSSETLSLSPVIAILQYFIYIKMLVHNSAKHMLLCKEKSDAFSRMNLLYKDIICVFDAYNSTRSELYC